MEHSELEKEPSELDKIEARYTRWMQGAMTVLLLLASLYAVSNNIADPDLWGHIQYGRDVMRDGIIHPTTTYSYTAEGYRWINHENLSEIFLAVSYDSLGNAGLLIGKFLIAAFIFVVMLRCGMKNGLSSTSAALLVLLVASNLAFHFSFRPQLLSFFWCAVMLWILDFSFRGWHEHYCKRPAETSDDDSEKQHTFNTKRVRLLWLMPLVLCLWANSHGGFVAGLCIYTAYLGGRTLEAFYWRGSRAWGIARRFAMMAFCGLLGTLVNPYGPDLHLWLLNSLGEPRPEISDWHGVIFTSANAMRLFLAAGVAAISFAVTKRKRDWVVILIMALVFWQAVEHIRHVAFFALLTGFWIAPHLASTIQRIRERYQTAAAPPSSQFSRRLMISTTAIGFVVLVGMCGWRLSEVRVQKKEYPVEAFQFMADQQVEGRLVVTYNWAQYAIGAFGGHTSDLPHCPVAFDGRFRTCYPQEIVDMHFDFVMGDLGPGSRHRSENSPPMDATLVLKHGQPEIVLISRRQATSVEVMNTQTDQWSLLYQDALAQVWGLKSKFDDPASDAYIALEDRRVSDEPQSGCVAYPALPQVHGSANKSVGGIARVNFDANATRSSE